MKEIAENIFWMGVNFLCTVEIQLLLNYFISNRLDINFYIDKFFFYQLKESPLSINILLTLFF